MNRDYNKEYFRDKERDTIIRFRLHNEKAEQFKKKLAKENKTMSEFLKEQINKYLE